MVDTEGAAAEDLANETGALDRLAASARGWHRVQMAVLGFIGFCGVFWDGGSLGAPGGMRWLAGALVVVAFVLAVVSVLLVGHVAYPYSRSAGTARNADEADLPARTRRLGTGIRVTYLALALVVAATLTGWWPAEPDDGTVVVGDVTGQVWCGQLVEAPAGEAGLATADGPVSIPLDRVAIIRPVGDC